MKIKRENSSLDEKHFDRISEYIDSNFDAICTLAMNISKIPSMTGKEEEKANYILETLKEFGCANPYIDEVGNVIYLHNSKGSSSNPYEGTVVFSAHIDTVFQDVWKINPVFKDDKIYAPSILDNSINVAGQIYLIKILMDLNLEIKKPILFVFDVGEEGLGNLKGIRHAIDQWKDRIEGVIALDLGYESVVDTAVGSRRYSVTIQTEGGHSWGDFGNHSAILYASKIINDIYKLRVPENPKTTYNVGIIKGGTSINTIAQDVELAVDLRSIDEASLDNLYKEFISIIEKHRSDQVRISMRTLGERPCGKTSHESNLIQKIIETRQEFGLELNFNASSTDANYPISLGIPAVSFGVGLGKGVHTLDEYLIAESVRTGMKHLMTFVEKYVGIIKNSNEDTCHYE
jgi:tripeptide aminopeptidase